MRPELEIICDWIRPGASVLDLGCGDGELLSRLRETHGIEGVGLEIDGDNIVCCVERGVSVIQADLDRGLSEYFRRRRFDYVVMTQTLQAVHHPARLLDEMLETGTEGIITFPNMGYWKNRRQLLLRGTMPMTRALPEDWFDTGNIHLCTLRDFENLCRRNGIRVLERAAVDYTHRDTLGIRLAPNLMGEIALYRLTRRDA